MILKLLAGNTNQQIEQSVASSKDKSKKIVIWLRKGDEKMNGITITIEL